MTFIVDWYQMPDGSWLAKCEAWPVWKYETEPRSGFYHVADRAAAEKSLRSYVRKHLRVDHSVRLGEVEVA